MVCLARSRSFTRRLAASRISDRLWAFIGFRQSPRPFFLRLAFRTKAPSLHRHYPVSSVLRASPPSHTARPVPHGLPVDSVFTSSPCGTSRVATVLLCARHAVTTTPTNWLVALFARFTRHGSFPHLRPGSAFALDCSGMCSVFIRITACLAR